MRIFRSCWLLVVLLATAGCLPTDDDIDNELEQQLSSVAGLWTGTSPTLTMSFTLQENAGTSVSGTGSMRETAVGGPVPITVTGTYSRPTLSLTFTGMNFEGREVQGTFTGNYTTVGGISGPVHLTATGYTKDVNILLQEQ